MSMFPIQSTVLTNNTTSSFVFSSIPQTYQHLRLFVYGRMYGNSQTTPYDLTITLNGASQTAAYHYMFADGYNTYSGGASGDTVFRFIRVLPNDSHTANAFGVAVIDIFDYASTTKAKTAQAISGFSNGTSTTPTNGSINMQSTMITSTSALSTLALASFGNFASGSRVDLYGINQSLQTGV